MSKTKVGKPRSTPRALAISEKSGGAAPLLAAAAAGTFGNGDGKWSDGDGRALEHLAIGVRPVLHCVFGCERLHLRIGIAERLQAMRNATSSIEWQAEQTSL